MIVPKLTATAFAGVIALASYLATHHAKAQDNMRGAVMVFAKGNCTSLVVSGRSYSCNAVVYAHLKNGRTSWQVPMPDGALMLSGARDSQPEPSRYILQIDTLRLSQGSSGRATGTCTANLSADGVYLHSLSCSATSAQKGVETIQLEFKGDGSPVDRKTL